MCNTRLLNAACLKILLTKACQVQKQNHVVLGHMDSHTYRNTVDCLQIETSLRNVSIISIYSTINKNIKVSSFELKDKAWVILRNFGYSVLTSDP